jgi:hypothetical protein
MAWKGTSSLPPSLDTVCLQYLVHCLNLFDKCLMTERLAFFHFYVHHYAVITQGDHRGHGWATQWPQKDNGVFCCTVQ